MKKVILGIVLSLAGAMLLGATTHTIPQERSQTAEIIPNPAEPLVCSESPADSRTVDDQAAVNDADTRLETFRLKADPNETAPEIAVTYWRSRDLIGAGSWTKARSILEAAVKKYPGSRHLRTQLAELLWYSYEREGKNKSLLVRASREAANAAEIGLTYGVTDGYLDWLLSQTLGRSGQIEILDRIFTQVVALDPSAEVYLDYARGLSLANDSRAEMFYKKSLAEKPSRNQALFDYAEWLLSHNREEEVLDLLPADDVSAPLYLHFLRGVAFERLGQLAKAKQEYERFAEFSRNFPAPPQFKIPGSKVQMESGIHFEIGQEESTKSSGTLQNVTAAISISQAIRGLTYLVRKEANLESPGGQRAVAWEVRNRVLRGTVYDAANGLGCPAVASAGAGASLEDRYKTVMCQDNGGQFNGVCLAWCSDPSYSSTTSSVCPWDSFANQVASDVYNGYAPDPVGHHCPGGMTSGSSYCGDTTTCRGGKTSYKLIGAVYNYGVENSREPTCRSLTSYSGINCSPLNMGKVCGNGGISDNCFYSTNTWRGSSYVGFLSQTGAQSFQPNGSYFSTTTGKVVAHLEGPETVDFDLALYWWDGQQWVLVNSSTRFSSIEDINHSGSSGFYTWRVYSFSGSGGFTLYTNP